MRSFLIYSRIKQLRPEIHLVSPYESQLPQCDTSGIFGRQPNYNPEVMISSFRIVIIDSDGHSINQSNNSYNYIVDTLF